MPGWNAHQEVEIVAHSVCGQVLNPNDRGSSISVKRYIKAE